LIELAIMFKFKRFSHTLEISLDSELKLGKWREAVKIIALASHGINYFTADVLIIFEDGL